MFEGKNTREDGRLISSKLCLISNGCLLSSSGLGRKPGQPINVIVSKLQLIKFVAD